MTSDAADQTLPAGKGGPSILAGFVGPQVRRLHYRFIASWQARFETLGLPISPVQGGILLLICESGAITQKELSDIMDVEQASMHETLRPLLAAGMVERAVNPGDRRSYVLSLTPMGRSAVATIHATIADHERAVLAALSDDEIAVLKTLLNAALAVRPGVAGQPPAPQ